MLSLPRPPPDKLILTMPGAPKHFTVSRQWQILKLIPTQKPGISARTLTDRLRHEGFAVTKRTVERDLNELSGQFGLTTSSRVGGAAAGWYFAAGSKCGIESVELVEALSLALAGDVLEQLMPPSLLPPISGRIRLARTKLQTVKGHLYSRWWEKVRFVPPALSLRPPRLNPKVLETVQRALLNECRLDVLYAPFNEKPKPLVLHPLSLVLRGAVPYLVATVDPYQDARLFAIHRMHSASMSTQAARVPKGYSLDDFIHRGGMEFGSGDPLVLRAVLSNELAILLAETPLSDDQKIVFRHGQWRLTASLRDTWLLRFWILAQGKRIEVLGPKRLRREIGQELMQACEPYRSE